MSARPSFAGRRQAVGDAAGDWVRELGTPPGRSLPLEVGPAVPDVDLPGWAGLQRERVAGWLARHGAVLFRGFDIGLDRFAAVVRAAAGAAEAYHERSSPRTELAERVYTSTDYPADQPIPLHNENSYQNAFPLKLFFCCLVPAERDGATPLADCRRVLARLDPEVLRAFQAKGVMYLRNYGDGVGLPWQEAFQTSDREVVEAYARRAGITVEWKPDGGLRTRQVRPALAVHPRTGETVWFNHAVFFHLSTLPAAVREGLARQFREEDLPSNTYYGDGSPIALRTLEHLRRAYTLETVAVPWRRGDVLLVDNLLAAHGREPYAGRRQVVVAMAETVPRERLPAPPGQPGAGP